MNKKLFNIGRLFSILAVVAFMLTACEKDDKSNPTFKATSPSFKLNVPANAANNIYDRRLPSQRISQSSRNWRPLIQQPR